MFLSHNNTWTNGYYAIISNPTGDRKESFYYGNRDNTADLLVMVLVVDCIVSTVAIEL